MKDGAFTADRLLALYDRVAEAEDAIPRLRRFVLDLAVRGKLVEQDPTDEPAAELLKRIAEEKRNGKKLSPETLPDQRGIDDVHIPQSWCWSTLGEVSLRLHYGYTASADPKLTDVRLLRITDIQDDRVDWSSVPGCVIDEKSLPSYALSTGDLLIARTGGTIGKTFLVSDLPLQSVFASYLIRVQPARSLLDRYVKLFCGSEIYWNQLRDGSRGGGQPNVNGQTLGGLNIPLPPLAEQHRIVAKVDELMALCDRLQAARAGREAVRDRLTAATLTRPTAPETDARDFPTHARFVLQTLPTFTTRPDQIKTLRQTILNLAVRGKLVEQDPTDEPAAELLKRAVVAKQRIRTERRIGRTEDPEFSTSAGEGSAPHNWVWANLADFALVLGGKRLPAGADFSAEPTDHIYIRVTDMKDGTILSDKLKFISSDVQAQIAKYTIDSDDIYITIAGTIGDVGDVPGAFHGQNLTENAAKIVFREVSKVFLLLVLNSQDVQDQFTEKTKQMAQPKLALKRILGARLPLPPLSEQHRIVAKVDALMALCDQLEASLTTATTTRSRLLEALLHEALEQAEVGTAAVP